jgi:Zn-dependent protease
VQRLGGSLAVAIVLFNAVAMRHFTSSQWGAWSLAWVFPAGFAIWMALEWLVGPWFAGFAARVNRSQARRFEVLRAAGIPILVDWSVPALLVAVLPAAFFAPTVVAALVVAELLVMLMHEAGHAAVVRRFGGRVISIEMSAIHGRTTYFSPMRPTPPVPVAWGGAVGQMLVAVPVSLQWLAVEDGPLARDVALFVLGPWNALIALVNLLPLPGLDGAIAWKGFRKASPTRRTKSGWKR